jgi:hypothetical protein
MKKLMTTAELANLLGKPQSWVFNNLESLRIPRIRLNNQYRYEPDAIEGWLREHEVSA